VRTGKWTPVTSARGGCRRGKACIEVSQFRQSDKAFQGNIVGPRGQEQVEAAKTELVKLDRETRTEVKQLLQQLAALGTDGPPDDGYWEWFDQFRKLSKQNQARIAAIRGALRAHDSQIREKRAKWLHLMQLDRKAFPADPEEGGDI